MTLQSAPARLDFGSRRVGGCCLTESLSVPRCTHLADCGQSRLIRQQMDPKNLLKQDIYLADPGPGSRFGSFPQLDQSVLRDHY